MNLNNQRYSIKISNEGRNKNILNPSLNNITNTSSFNRESKRESLQSVPLANNIGDENSFFNSIIHMLYFTPEIFIFLEENKQNFKNDYEILLELYKILDKYDKLLDKNQCYLIPEEERFVDIKNLRNKISLLYKGEKIFQLCNSDEPSEILYFFLNAICLKDVKKKKKINVILYVYLIVYLICIFCNKSNVSIVKKSEW